MRPPETQVQPKDRAQLWKETIVGGVLFLAGLATIAGYVWHQLSPEHTEHQPEVTILTIGCVMSFSGLWWMNRKLAREFVTDMLGWVTFWKRGGDADA